MTKDEITRIAQKLRNTYHVTEPEKLCQILDIWYDYMPMGTETDCIKGFINRSNRCYCIIINDDLPEELKRIIMFHEIGHYALKHMSKTICTFKDYGIYNVISDTENEANLFVAEYLLDSEETMRTLRETNSFFQTAAILNVPPEILDYKWRMLSYYKRLAGQSPIQVNSDCLKHIQISRNSDSNMR
ncbi:MAG: ImmA/IrrE family metallo-endopeptidase [Clostridia bacterium]|nr:ImmA/IrrE family metallo-endopeptidase [Anaerostipes sp.]NCC02130.1 ImmA/IrrE family metallo-endopeptidase [Clostridia bacterium]NCD04203.1 ImmA/IrrE family metallo-endopeptidase [Clostridia bacterium]